MHNHDSLECLCGNKTGAIIFRRESESTCMAYPCLAKRIIANLDSVQCLLLTCLHQNSISSIQIDLSYDKQ